MKLTEKEKENIYKKCVDVFGVDYQYLCANEEMGELIWAISKYQRKLKNNSSANEVKKTKENVIEEIADVLNVVETLRYLFGKEEVDKVRREKLTRALKRCQSSDTEIK